jgi:Tol biopolymer transport system component
MIPGVAKGGYQYAEVSVISRDGKQVAYAWYDDTIGRYGLQIANLNGDPNPRHVFDRADIQWISPQDWSPDGKWIVARLSAKERNSKMGQIGLIAVQDGSLRVLNVVGSPDGIHFSADGQYLAYDRLRSDTSSVRHLFLLSTAGSREIPVVAGPTQEKMVGWSPDGKCLLFSSDRTGSIGLWALPVVNGAPQGQPSLVYESFGQGYPMGLTAAGALYYYVGVTRTTLPRIQVATFDLSTGKILSPPADVAEEGILDFESSPTWSADGKFLAYRSQRTGTGASIKIWSAETGRVVREFRPEVENQGGWSLIGWARDGSYLVVAARTQVLRVDALTGNTSTLATLSRLLQPGWSEDGRRLYFRDRTPGGDAYIELDLAFGAEREVVRRPWLAAANISPDGRYIATASIDSASNSRTLLVIPIAGGEPREMMRVPSDLDPPNLTQFGQGQQLRVLLWAADSRSLLVRKLFSDGKQPEELWNVPLDGGAPRKLDGRLDVNAERNSGAGVFLSPDGRRIAFVPAMPSAAQRLPAQVWSLENFLPVAKGAPAAK